MVRPPLSRRGRAVRSLLASVLAAALLPGDPAWAAPRTSPEVQELLERRARDEAAEALFAFDEGDYTRAAGLYEQLLTGPQRLRERQDLHDAFLHWAFSHFLLSDLDRARELLEMALQLDPEYQPSPVLTRPDLFQFYTAEREAWVGTHGTVPKNLDRLFPELAPAGLPVEKPPPEFFPAFGIGLAYHGQPEVGRAMRVAEFTVVAINLASVFFRLAMIRDLSPDGQAATRVWRQVTYVSAPISWSLFGLDFAISVGLHGEARRPSWQRRRPKPGVVLLPTGMGLRF